MKTGGGEDETKTQQTQEHIHQQRKTRGPEILYQGITHSFGIRNTCQELRALVRREPERLRPKWLPGKLKIWCLRFGLLLHLTWPMVCEIPVTKVEKLEMTVSSYIKWLGLPCPAASGMSAYTITEPWNFLSLASQRSVSAPKWGWTWLLPGLRMKRSMQLFPDWKLGENGSHLRLYSKQNLLLDMETL